MFGTGRYPARSHPGANHLSRRKPGSVIAAAPTGTVTPSISAWSPSAGQQSSIRWRNARRSAGLSGRGGIHPDKSKGTYRLYK